MLEYLTMGIVLGLSAGLAPGPMLTLVFSETLRHGLGAGIRIALAPLFSDLPIIVLAIWVLSQLTHFEFILGCLSLVGGAVVFYMGIESLKSELGELRTSEVKARSLSKGILTNLLNPHPYLFWFGVGAPIMSQASVVGLSGPLAFISSFYILLVGSKMILAVIAARSRKLLQGRWYRITMQALGLCLCLLAILLVRDGLMLMEIL